jgi:hypothetical protein
LSFDGRLVTTTKEADMLAETYRYEHYDPGPTDPDLAEG